MDNVVGMVGEEVMEVRVKEGSLSRKENAMVDVVSPCRGHSSFSNTATADACTTITSPRPPLFPHDDGATIAAAAADGVVIAAAAAVVLMLPPPTPPEERKRAAGGDDTAALP